MTSNIDSDTILPSNEMSDLLSRVRQLDPTSDEAAVRGYLREMAEAEAVLDSVELESAPLEVSFSGQWAQGWVR